MTVPFAPLPPGAPGYPPREPLAMPQGGYPGWVFPPGGHAPLTPPDLDTYLSAGYAWKRTPAFYPAPWLVYEREGRVSHPDRDRVITVTNLPAGTEAWQNVTFDVPGTIVALTGGANETAGAGFPVGWEPLDTFSVNFELAQREKLTTQAGIAHAIIGTAERPRWLVLDAWAVSNATVLRVGITPHLANLRITVNLMFIETRGPTNVSGG